MDLSKLKYLDILAVIGCIVLGYLSHSYPVGFGTFISYLVFKGVMNSQAVGKDKAKFKSINGEQIKSFGATAEEREKNIKKLFDRKDNVISCGDWYEFKGWNSQNQRQANSIIWFKISRHVSAMAPNERDFLKQALLLYNSGKLTRKSINYYLLAFVYGNGKCSIDTWNYRNNHESFKDGPGLVKFFADKSDASVESATNNLLLEGGGPIGENPWLDEDDLKDTACIYNKPGGYPIQLGLVNEVNIPITYNGEGSLMTIAPPRSGKSQCFVVPNMLHWKSSAVVLDISGEIYEMTHKWRSKNVGPVYKFNPLHPNDSHSYNPLSSVREEPDNIWEDAKFLADMMIVPSGAQDPIWENLARDVLTSAIAYIVFYNEPGERHMSKVLDIIYGIGWDEMITSLKTNSLVGSMRRMGNSLGDMEKKQRDSVLITAQSSLSAWSGERISRTTQKSDWNPLDLRTNGNITIYICIQPNEIDSYLSVLRVFIAQHVEVLLNKKPEHGAVTPILFMLDEFPRLKNMPIIDKALNAGAKYGIRLWMFAQSYGQLKESYENAEGMLGSCAVRSYMNLPLSDELTTKISDQLGYRDGLVDGSRPKIVEPLELAGPNFRDLVLIFATNTKPAKVRKNFAYADPELKEKMNS